MPPNAWLRMRPRKRAVDLIEIDCDGAHTIRARIASPGILAGEREFEFVANDAVRVREGEPD